MRITPAILSDMKCYPPMYKSELQRASGASVDDFKKFLRDPVHRAALAALGNKPTCHKLNPKGVQYVVENYNIDL